MDKQEIRQRIDLVGLISQTVALTKDGKNFKGLCPFHDDHNPSLVVYPDTRWWQCYGCKKGGDCFEWYMRACKVDFATALDALRRECGAEAEVNTTTWDITDVDGNLIAQHMRYDRPDGTKDYSWMRDGRKGLGGMGVADLPLYGIKHLFDMGSAAVKDIIIVEGEKAADALIRAGYAALGTVTGASTCPNPEVFAPLVGWEAQKHLWRDNDAAGRAHMDKVAGRLRSLGVEPFELTWPDAPPKGDAYDFLRAGADVRALLAAAIPYPRPVGHENVSTGWGGDMRSDNPTSSGTRTKLGQELGHAGVRTVTELEDSDIAGQVREWVSHTSGWFTNDEIDRELGFTTLVAKDYRGKIMRRLKQQGIVDQHTKVNKQWRYVNTRLTFLDFKAASNVTALPVKWPLEIENYVKLFPGNLAVVAGAPNAGKTALLLNFLRLNMRQFPIYYFCSEMGQVELKDRLEMFPGMAIDDWHFKAAERSSDFEDVIVPDCINIIDFLEMTDELYRVNTHLTNISHKIGNGLAIVAIQKKEGAKYGRGLEFGLEKPKLYLSMDQGKLTIVKGKTWVNPRVDPNGLTVNFKINRGCQFEITKECVQAAQ